MELWSGNLTAISLFIYTHGARCMCAHTLMHTELEQIFILVWELADVWSCVDIVKLLAKQTDDQQTHGRSFQRTTSMNKFIFFGQFTWKSNIAIFLLTCSSVYVSRFISAGEMSAVSWRLGLSCSKLKEYNLKNSTAMSLSRNPDLVNRDNPQTSFWAVSWRMYFFPHHCLEEKRHLVMGQRLAGYAS